MVALAPTAGIAIASLPLFAGCVAQPTAAADWPTLYVKAGVTREQLNADGMDCRWNAEGDRMTHGQSYFWGGIPGLVKPFPTPEAHAACMKDKGYTFTR